MLKNNAIFFFNMFISRNVKSNHHYFKEIVELGYT